MSEKPLQNTPTNTEDPRINDLRGAFEHRALWFGLLIDEARKRGLDETFAREAILRLSLIHI